MKIHGSNPVESKDLYNKVRNSKIIQSETEYRGNAQNTNVADTSADKISLSGKAREISELKSLLEQLPEIRTDRVEEIKKAVDTGSYNIDSLKVAEKILQEL